MPYITTMTHPNNPITLPMAENGLTRAHPRSRPRSEGLTTSATSLTHHKCDVNMIECMPTWWCYVIDVLSCYRLTLGMRAVAKDRVDLWMGWVKIEMTHVLRCMGSNVLLSSLQYGTSTSWDIRWDQPSVPCTPLKLYHLRWLCMTHYDMRGAVVPHGTAPLGAQRRYRATSVRALRHRIWWCEHGLKLTWLPVGFWRRLRIYVHCHGHTNDSMRKYRPIQNYQFIWNLNVFTHVTLKVKTTSIGLHE